jgi:surfeit locus 1 family protein
MRRSTILFLVIAIASAAGCIRLGFWQLDRRQERRQRNAIVAERMKASPVPVGTLTEDTSTIRFRRVRVSGQPDFEHEFLLTLRGHNGSPGVDVITPFRVAGTDTAILVNRGWIYSPDGMTAELARWREPDTAFTGYVELFDTGSSSDSVRRNGIRRMSYDAIARTLPYPIRTFYVVATADSTPPGGTKGVVRLALPALDEGPHMSYAFQWFAFGTIALVGGGIVAARSMRI